MGKGAVHVCFHPKDPNDAAKGVCGSVDVEHHRESNKLLKSQSKKLGINATGNFSLCRDVSFEASNIIFHIKTKHSVPSSCSAHANNRGSIPPPTPANRGFRALDEPGEALVVCSTPRRSSVVCRSGDALGLLSCRIRATRSEDRSARGMSRNKKVQQNASAQLASRSGALARYA